MRLAPLVPTPRPKPSAPVVQRKPKPTVVSPPREAEDESEEASELRESDVVGSAWSSAGGSESPRAPQGESSAWRGGISTKLRVGKSDDPLEREADAIADRIMRMPVAEWSTEPSTFSASPAHEQLRRACCSSCTTCDEEEDDSIMREPAAGQRGGMASEGFSGRVRGQLGRGGRTLSAYARNFLEPRLGLDLGGIRLHVDAEAGSLSRQIHARAFTLGQHIFFAPGELRPETSEGMRLLAHEVAHTLQGRRAGELHRARRPDPLVINTTTDDPLAGIDDEPEGEPEPYIALDDSFLAAERRRLAREADPDAIEKLERLLALGEALDAALQARLAGKQQESEDHVKRAKALSETIESSDALDWYQDGITLWTGDYTHGVFVRMVELDIPEKAIDFRNWTKKADPPDTHVVEGAIKRCKRYLEISGKAGIAAEVDQLTKLEDKVRTLLPVAKQRAEANADDDAARDYRTLEEESYGLHEDYQTDLNMWDWTLERVVELAKSGKIDDARVAIEMAVDVIEAIARVQAEIGRKLGPRGFHLAIGGRAHFPDEDSDTVGYLRSLHAMTKRAVMAWQVASEVCINDAMQAGQGAAGLLDFVQNSGSRFANLEMLDENYRLIPLASLQITVVAEQVAVPKSGLPKHLGQQFDRGQKEGNVIIDYHRNVEAVEPSEIDQTDAILFSHFDPGVSAWGVPALTQTVQEMIGIRERQIDFIREVVLGSLGESVRQNDGEAFSPNNVQWMESAIYTFYKIVTEDIHDRGVEELAAVTKIPAMVLKSILANVTLPLERKQAFDATIDFVQMYLKAFTVHPQYNIWDRDRYLSRTFPRTLAGQLVHDCGVYAMRAAYMLGGVAQDLGLRFHLALLPTHLALIITGEGIGVYALNNDQITEIGDEDIAFATPEDSNPEAEIERPSDEFIGEVAARAFIRGANMPYVIVELDAQTMISGTALEDLYLNVINPLDPFGEGARKTRVDALDAEGNRQTDKQETIDLTVEHIGVSSATTNLYKQVARMNQGGVACAEDLLERWFVSDIDGRATSPAKYDIAMEVFASILEKCVKSESLSAKDILADEQVEAVKQASDLKNSDLKGLHFTVKTILEHCLIPVHVDARIKQVKGRYGRLNDVVAKKPQGALADGVKVTKKNDKLPDDTWAAIEGIVKELDKLAKRKRKCRKKGKGRKATLLGCSKK